MDKPFLIFCDIDGVLISERFLKQRKENDPFLRFDPQCLHPFEQILRQYPHTQVVITSSWRSMRPASDFPPLFSPDCQPQIIGITPFVDEDDPATIAHLKFHRYREVLTYLTQHHHSHTPWVAIDDIAEHYPPELTMIATDPYQGFTQKDADQLSALIANNR